MWDTKTLNLSRNMVAFHVLGRFFSFFTLQDQLVAQRLCFLMPSPNPFPIHIKLEGCYNTRRNLKEIVKNIVLFSPVSPHMHIDK